MKDGVKIVVPDDLATMTTYVVEEQGDWFEAELPFVRKVIQPGDKVLDVGANFGCYALPMALRAGPTGSVLAWEPTSSTAAFLRRSIEENRFTWLRLEQAALWDADGELALAIGDSPELNQLAPAGAPTGTRIEMVRVKTLAAYATELAGVSFMKIDAEGSEVAILQGAGEVFQREDPLVMFELMHGAHVNEALIDAFTTRGFGIYRLVTGLGTLRRFERATERHLAGLNLFAAKPPRAEALAKRSLLVDSLPAKVDLDRTFANERYGKAPLRSLVRGKKLPASMAWFWMAKDHPELPVRAHALDRALEVAKRDVRERPSIPRRLTLARIALEAGDRGPALAELNTLLTEIDLDQREGESPFLPPLERYDAIDAGESIGPFMAAATVEAMTRSSAFSGFFEGTRHLQLYEAFLGLPFPEPSMKKRYEMMKTRLQHLIRHDWA
jgi:FkbM family methyltransferase